MTATNPMFQKAWCQTFAITSSVCNRFWKVFHHWKQKWLIYKINIIFSPFPKIRVKHKSLKMLQFFYQSLMTKLCQTFMITLWIVNRFEKVQTKNLQHRFTASITTHSISILLQELLKVSSFGLYASTKTCSINCLSTALCWRPRQISNSFSMSWTRDWYMHRWTTQ